MSVDGVTTSTDGPLAGSSSYERTCHVDFGIEPNYYDYDCKSYYNCKNYWGSLYYCPSGYQFDFEHLSCEKDEDVLCKWQLEHHQKSDSSSSGSNSFSGSPGSSRPSGSGSSGSQLQSGMVPYHSSGWLKQVLVVVC